MRIGSILTALILSASSSPCFAQATGIPFLIVGERATHELRFTSAAVSDFSALLSSESLEQPGLSRSFEIEIVGEVETTVLRTDGNLPRLAWRLKDPDVSFRVDGRDAPADARRIAEGLERVVHVTLTPAGHVREVRLDGSLGSLSSGMGRALIAAVQVVVASDNGSIWTVAEEDPNGPYLARYEVLGETTRESPDVATIRKRKVRYLGDADRHGFGGDRLPTSIVPAGSMTARYDRRAGRLLSLAGTESQVFSVAGREVARTETSIELNDFHGAELDAAESARVWGEAMAREARGPGVSLAWRPDPSIGRAALDRNTLGDADLDELLAEIQRAEGGERGDGETQLFLKLRSLLSLEPATAERIAMRLNGAPSGSLTFGLLAGTLSAAGHAEAQAALAEVLKRRRGEPEIVNRLLPLLAAVEEPTLATEATLRGLAFDSLDPELAHAARLALGAVARAVSVHAPERGEEIVASLIAVYGREPEGEMVLRLLSVLGNTGARAALPIVKRYLGSASIERRVAATAALRFIPGPESDSLLAGVLVDDPVAEVRREAADAMGYRPVTESMLEAQSEAFRNEATDPVRLTLLENIWFAGREFTAARHIVEEAAEADSSDQVRAKAARLVGSEPRGTAEAR